MFGISKLCIENYINDMISCIKQGNAQIELNANRNKNLELIAKYNLSHKDIYDDIKSLRPENFVKMTNNKKLGREHEVLYIFRKDKVLLNKFTGKYDAVILYIKTFLEEHNYLYIISYHEADKEKPLEFYFK